MMCGFSVSGLIAANASVWPSSAFATASMPIVPPAPARLSTTTAWPRSTRSFSAIMRATTSFTPPAG